MKRLWNNIFGGLLMDQANPNAGGDGGGSGAGGASFLTPSQGGGQVPPNQGDAGAASGAGGNNAANNAGANNPSQGAAASDWRSALPKELQEDATIKKFGDVSTLAKSYLNAQKLIGADKIVVPGKHTTEEEWTQIYRKLGVPEKLDEYGVKFKEGVSIDDKFSNAFKEIAHKNHVSPKQAQALADWFSDINSTSEAEVKAEIQKNFQKEQDLLKKEWGNSYELNLSRANKVINELGGEEVLKALTVTGAAGNRQVIQFLAKVGETLYKDHKFVEAQGSSNVMSPAELDKEIGRLKMDSAYTDKYHPNHKHAVDEMKALFEKRYNSK